MFSSVFSKSIWESHKSILVWSVSMALLLLMMVMLFPSMGESGQYAAMANDMPDAIKAFVGEIGDASTPAGFLGVEIYSMMLPIMLLVVAVGHGAKAIGKEEDSGTLELLLASPLSRARILIQKMMAMVTNVFIVGMSAVVGIYIGKIFIEFEIAFDVIFWATFVASLLAVVYGVLTLVFTALGASRGTATGITVGIYIVSYFMNTLPSVITKLEPLRDFSLNRYGDAQTVLLHEVNYGNILVLLAVSAVFYLVARMAFARRDIGV